MKIGKIVFDSWPVVLAPMEDITDQTFRFFCKQQGADLMFTEFVSSEGLIRNAGKSRLKMTFSQEERPMGIQVFGHNEDSMERATAIAASFEPDLIDINYGCPVKKVVNRGAGAAMLKDVPGMVSMTQTVVKATTLPVTVKTRLGWDGQSKNIVEVTERLQDTGIQALTIHARTRSQLYSGKADWTLIGEVKNNPRMHIPIIGNGDIDSPVKAKEMIDRYGVDGIMVGRACVGNPYLFRQIKEYLHSGTLLPDLDLEARITHCLSHLEKAVEVKGERVAVIEMRKLYPGYFRGLTGFKPYKMALLPLTTLQEVKDMMRHIAEQYAKRESPGE